MHHVFAMQKDARLVPYTPFDLESQVTYNDHMSRWGTLGNVTNPLIIVQWIIAISAIVGGLYLLSPVWNASILINTTGPITQVIASTVGIALVALFAIFTGVLMIAGIVKRKVKWRSAGLFMQGMLRLYALLAGILINGFFPMTWLSSAVLLAITFYIWGRIRRRGIE